jgi:hypothetical protein
LTGEVEARTDASKWENASRGDQGVQSGWSTEPQRIGCSPEGRARGFDLTLHYHCCRLSFHANDQQPKRPQTSKRSRCRLPPPVDCRVHFFEDREVRNRRSPVDCGTFFWCSRKVPKPSPLDYKGALNTPVLQAVAILW